MDTYKQAHALFTTAIGQPQTPGAYEAAVMALQGSLRGLADFADGMDRPGDYATILKAYLAVTATAWAGVRTACAIPAQTVGAPS